MRTEVFMGLEITAAARPSRPSYSGTANLAAQDGPTITDTGAREAAELPSQGHNVEKNIKKSDFKLAFS